MSRRRYLSTDISIDTAVNRLARTAGDFAVMLYTWMIPHCDDDGTMPGDPEVLLWLVVPGFRHKDTEDIINALAAIRDVGLLESTEDGRVRIDRNRWGGPRIMGTQYRLWRDSVLRRDGYRCVVCGSTDEPLHAHHILPWASYVEDRYSLSNGIALCVPCHYARHRSGGDV